MRLLAIDSAAGQLSIAAVETADGAAASMPMSGAATLAIDAFAPLARVLARDLEGGAEASRQALPALLALIAEAGWSMADLDAIAFGQGPGGFTGLRTACSVAQGLAFGLGVPVLPIDSLRIVVEAARPRHAPALAPADGGDVSGLAWGAMDARMGEVYAAAWRWQDGAGWLAAVAPCLCAPDALARAWAHEAPVLVAGSALAAFADRLPSGSWVAESEPADRAAALARLAAAAWRQGAARPAAEALPIYLRDKVAMTTAERVALKAAGGVG